MLFSSCMQGDVHHLNNAESHLVANLLLHILDGFLHFIQLSEQLLHRAPLLLLLPVVLPQKRFVYSETLLPCGSTLICVDEV